MKAGWRPSGVALAALCGLMLAGALDGLVAVALAAPGGAGGARSDSPCQGKTGTKPVIRVDLRRGLDLRQFRVFVGRDTYEPTGRPDADHAAAAAARWRAYQDALRQVNRLQGVSYSKSRERYESAMQAYVTNGDQSILRRDIRPLIEMEEYDYDRCVFAHEVTLGVRTPAQLDELDAPLDEAVGGWLQRLSSDGDTIEINLSDLFRYLRQDPRFVGRVKESWNDDAQRNSLMFKDDDTQLFLESVALQRVEISNYDRGQYRPSAVLASIIVRAVRPKVLSFLKHYQRVGVTCTGSTDRLPITAGIPYTGEGRYTGAGGSLILDSPSGRPQGSTLRDNIQLSFARAYEALAILGANIARPERLTLRYVGRGELPGDGRDDPLSRKITFEIRGRDRYE